MTQHIGFTGTQKGLTPPQAQSLQNVLHSFDGGCLHHGDCVGADAEAHAMARGHGFSVWLHPPTDDSKRAFCAADEAEAPLPYLKRNRKIVDSTSMLIATPSGMRMKLRSGTWATVRYALAQNKLVWVIFPDGTLGAPQ